METMIVSFYHNTQNKCLKYTEEKNKLLNLKEIIIQYDQFILMMKRANSYLEILDNFQAIRKFQMRLDNGGNRDGNSD